ncbi:MAG TPA: DNA-binding response regulator, partial [Bacteroidales bacterium]|nr:DNA-binding response regulator [Bacteroidales bacterium]
TDFRIISTTNHDIEERVERKNFRLDLLHRLNTLHIHIPALRERPEDIKPLVEHYIEVFSTKLNKPDIQVAKEVFAVLKKYDFPGNVRELRNMTERAIMLCKDNSLGIDDFRVKSHRAEKETPKVEEVDLRLNEIKMIRKALQMCKYNQQTTADALGIHRDALSRKMKKYNIKINKTEE